MPNLAIQKKKSID